jgi:tape measure domain-containing protein
MQNKISVLVALEGADADLNRTLDRADQRLNRFGETAQGAGRRASEGLRQLETRAGTLGEQFTRARNQVVAFLAAFELQRRVVQIVALADAWSQMEARLKLATAGSREFAVAQRELFATAQRLGVPIQELTTLYGRLAQIVRQLGGDQRQALAITEAVAQALRISGATAGQAQAALLQFGQALQSGVLRGDEFNSLMENGGRLAQALADGLGVSTGRLRAMAEQGKLTADVVVGALLSQKDKLAAEYASLPATVGQAFTRLSNAFGQWVHKLDESTGFTRKLAAALDWLAQNLDTVMEWLGRIAQVGLAVLAYRMIPALITAWQLLAEAAVAAASRTVAAWAVANQSIGGAVAAVGKLRIAFAALAAFLIGWEIGTWLSEKFAVVRQAGVAMVAVLESQIERLRYAWEAFAAVFTDDTIAAATARHEARLAEMRRILGEMWADAERQRDGTQAAMDQAAAAAEEIAKRLTAVRQGTQEAIGRAAESVTAALGQLDGQIAKVEARANQAHQTIEQTLGQLATSYAGLGDIAQAALTRALAAEEERHAKLLANLQAVGVAERQRIVESAELLAETLKRQTALRAEAAAETLRLIDEEAAARRAAAGDSAAALARVETETLALKRRTLAEALADYQHHVDALNAEAQRHLDAVRRIEDEKRALTQSTEERVRELYRSTLTAVEQYQDRQREIVELQTKARQALARGEFEDAKRYAKEAADLAAQSAQAVREGDKEIVSQKQAVKRAIDSIHASEKLTLEALDQEAAAHRNAAEEATQGRQRVLGTLRETQREIDAITAKLQDELTLSIRADTQSLDEALAALDAAITEKERLLPIKADLEAAQRELKDFEERLKAGQTLPVNANTDKAEAALAKLAAYAKETSAVELRLATDKAQAAIGNVERQIAALSDLQTQSKHLVETNAAAARAEIEGLNGANTSSTHTIYVQRVETNAAGGLVGIARFARGGLVGARFAPMAEGRVPGTGDGDTVPRALPAGAFVLRKAAVRHYGEALIARLARAVQRFARGGPVAPKRPPREYAKQNREIAEALQLVDLGLKGMAIYTRETVRTHLPGTTSPSFVQKTMSYFGEHAGQDREFLRPLLFQRELDPMQQMRLKVILQRWQQAASQPLIYGKNLWAEFQDWKERQDPALYFAGGGRARGAAASDTVPALLTPGEFVVRRDVVSRLGAGFFAALNAMRLPKDALAQRVRGFARGGLVAPLTRLAVGATALAGTDLLRTVMEPLAAMLRPAPLPSEAAGAAPMRTVRVELAAGHERVSTTIDARDETRLLDLLKRAQARAI